MGLKIATYNCRGLKLGTSHADMCQRLVVEQLMSEADIVCLQETWLSKQDLGGLNNISQNVHGIGESTTDLSDKVVRGHIPGGVAILWNTKCGPLITELRLGVDWAVGVTININNRKFVILNVYFPYEKSENESDFLNALGSILTTVEELDTTSVFVIGDMNADISDARSMFGNHLQNFCSENGFILSSKFFLPVDSFTYVSDAWHTTSWLDHCICTTDAHDAINNIEIKYNMATSDHIPVLMDINFKNIPEVAVHTNVSHKCKIDWSRLKESNLAEYYSQTDNFLKQVNIPVEALACRNVNCTHNDHVSAINDFYNDITQCLKSASEPFLNSKKKKGVHVPGWNEYVKELHNVARDTFLVWKENGKPRFGPIFELKKRSNNRFKYALRYIKTNDNMLRKESLAKKLCTSRPGEFWKEVKLLNNSSTPLPSNIENTVGDENIAELWRNHYFNIFNCVKNNINDFNYNVDYCNEMIVNVNELREVINKLDNNKACGEDGLSAEHLKYASDRIFCMLSLCFTSFFVHGNLPSEMISIILTPVIKDKTCKINSKDNYRPIALASVLSKIFEGIMYTRLEMYILTHDNQFGFKRKHGTDMCIYSLKEIVLKYRSLNTSMFLCFLDASKAFDRIDHSKLFQKLHSRGTPTYLIRMLIFWYRNQTMMVRWGSKLSAPFTVSNGVRQGGILSPYLFNVYMDDLSLKLNACKIGCISGDLIINHLMYADDLVIFSPCSIGLSRLLKVCTEYGIENNIMYNSKKSAVMIVRSELDKNILMPKFHLNGNFLPVVKSFKYLGHYISDDLRDDLDIQRQCRQLYRQGNMLIRRFNHCTPEVKVSLFRSFCSPLYTAQLWYNFFVYNFKKLKVAYNDILKMLFSVPRWHSSSEMFVNLRIPDCKAVIRNLIYKFMCRLNCSQNMIINNIVSSSRSDVKYLSKIFKFWYDQLYL